MAEYGILIAIVIGAAIAMQQYMKSRLQGATRGFSDNYVTAVGATAGVTIAPFEPNRTVDTASNQNSNLTMGSARAGTRTEGSTADTISVTTK